MPRAALSALILLISACAQNTPSADWQRGQTGTVSRVIDGDSLVLEDGLVVRLVSVEAPSFGYRGREDHPYAEDAKEALESLVLGRRVELYYPGLTQDRYERALAQVTTTDEAGHEIWVNEAMLQAGAAWVRLYPDTAAGSEDLWHAEDTARENGIGLWASASPAISAADALSLDGSFSIVAASLAPGTRAEDDCVHAAKASALTIRYSAAQGCQNFDDTRVEIRGWARNGELNAGYSGNLRVLPSDQ